MTIPLVAQAEERLHAQGGRMTEQRRLIIDALEKFSSHPTAEELFARVQKIDPRVHISTVYRTLKLMQDVGLVTRHSFDKYHREGRFAPMPQSEQHLFLCESCRKVVEFRANQSNQIKMQFARQFDAQVDSVAIVLYGLCEDCIGRSG